MFRVQGLRIWGVKGLRGVFIVPGLIAYLQSLGFMAVARLELA